MEPAKQSEVPSVFYNVKELTQYKTPNPNSKRRTLKEEPLERFCFFCFVDKTPEWRAGAGNSKLCNGCGLSFKKLKKLIPAELIKGDKKKSDEETFAIYEQIAVKLDEIILKKGGYESKEGAPLAKSHKYVLGFMPNVHNLLKETPES